MLTHSWCEWTWHVKIKVLVHESCMSCILLNLACKNEVYFEVYQKKKRFRPATCRKFQHLLYAVRESCRCRIKDGNVCAVVTQWHLLKYLCFCPFLWVSLVNTVTSIEWYFLAAAPSLLWPDSIQHARIVCISCWLIEFSYKDEKLIAYSSGRVNLTH